MGGGSLDDELVDAPRGRLGVLGSDGAEEVAAALGDTRPKMAAQGQSDGEGGAGRVGDLGDSLQQRLDGARFAWRKLVI